MEVTQAGPDIVAMAMVIIAIIALGLLVAGSSIYFWKYLVDWIKYKDREKKSLEFVLLQVTVPRGNEIKIDAAEQLFATFASLKKSGGWFASFNPQPWISFELVALHESIRFYISCHKNQKDLVEKQLNGAYPDAEIKEVQEYNI